MRYSTIVEKDDKTLLEIIDMLEQFERDKSTKSVQETVINKTVSNQGSKGVNIIQGKKLKI